MPDNRRSHARLFTRTTRCVIIRILWMFEFKEVHLPQDVTHEAKCRRLLKPVDLLNVFQRLHLGRKTYRRKWAERAERERLLWFDCHWSSMDDESGPLSQTPFQLVSQTPFHLPPCTHRNWPFMRAANGRQSNASMHASYTFSEYFILPVGKGGRKKVG